MRPRFTLHFLSCVLTGGNELGLRPTDWPLFLMFTYRFIFCLNCAHDASALGIKSEELALFNGLSVFADVEASLRVLVLREASQAQADFQSAGPSGGSACSELGTTGLTKCPLFKKLTVCFMTCSLRIISEWVTGSTK